MGFEWVVTKEASNKQKHGIIFNDAATVFDDPHHLVEDSTRPEDGEERSKMGDNGTIKARRLPDGTIVQELADGTLRPLTEHSDWARVDAMTEAEVEANALADPDNPPLTAEELQRMKPVPNPRAIRRRLHLSQKQFALRFHLPLGTIRDWELGRREPDTAAKNLLRVIERNPQVVIDALQR